MRESWLSIVVNKDDHNTLLVRSRYEGDIERVFPGVEPEQFPGADYRFRAFLPKKVVADAMAAAVQAIDYPNFKNSISGSGREVAAHKIWGIVDADAHRP